MNEGSKQKDVGRCEAGSTTGSMECCNVDAIITIDSRGQIVLPKEVREKAGIKPGDKFAVISCESGGKVCCISLVKADDFADMVKDMLGPMLKGILR